MNSFDDMDRIGPCWNTGECPYCAEDFLRFTNAPEILPVERVRGSVVLVGGRPGHGKTVYGHRLLHEYNAQGLQPLDLLGEGPYHECLARRQDVLFKLRASVGPLESDDLDDAQIDDDRWAAALREVMSRANKAMVVRLPCVKRNVSSADDKIAWEICQYANAAEKSKSVFVYEYNTRDWPADWDLLCHSIGEYRDSTVRIREVGAVDQDELWDFVMAAKEHSPYKDITLNGSVPDLAKYVFKDQSIDPRSALGLMHLVFVNAVKNNSPQVTLDHLMPEIMRMGGRAA